MWNDTIEKVPEKDGEYIVQTVFGRVTSMNYTVANGWNTSEDSTESAIKDDMYIVRWLEPEAPPAVPKGLSDVYLETRMSWEEYRKALKVMQVLGNE
jgi:hypothetical protein